MLFLKSEEGSFPFEAMLFLNSEEGWSLTLLYAEYVSSNVSYFTI